MPALRELLTGLGYADVETYLQSGNAVFTADAPASRVAADVGERLAAEVGVRTEVILRTADELRAVVDRNPMRVGDPARFMAWFLLEPPAPGWLDGLDLALFAPEQMSAGRLEIYLDLPN